MQKRWVISIGAVAGIFLLYTGALASIVFRAEPIESPLAKWPLFPIACTTRGCITTASWIRQHQLATAFAQAINQEAADSSTTLTTIIRRHLIENALLGSPIQTEDIDRYREEILHASDDASIQQYLPITAEEYDKVVLKPFLQQESLRFQHKVETTEELYRILANERLVFLLVTHYKWDSTTGSAQRR